MDNMAIKHKFKNCVHGMFFMKAIDIEQVPDLTTKKSTHKSTLHQQRCSIDKYR